MSTQNKSPNKKKTSKPSKTTHPLETQLKLTFKNHELLELAFTHSSFAKQHRGNHGKDNERLEFFGDAILKFVVSQYLYDNFKEKNEGELTKVRSQIISDATLYSVAIELNFNDYIHLSYSESKTKGELKPSILSDAVEAFIGALYIDKGLITVTKFIIQHIIEPKLKDLEKNPITDYKSIVQEYLQKTVKQLPSYTIIKETGPEHAKVFTVRITFQFQNETVSCLGTGTNKKKAEQSASKSAYIDYIQSSITAS